MPYSQQKNPLHDVKPALRDNFVNEDEIDIVELIYILIQYKWYISLSTFAVATIAVIYLLFAPTIYRTEAVVMPPLPEKTNILNLVSKPINNLVEFALTPENVFDRYISHFEAVDNLHAFCLTDKTISEFLNKINTPKKSLFSFWSANSQDNLNMEKHVLHLFVKSLSKSLTLVKNIKADKKESVTVQLQWTDSQQANFILSNYIVFVTQKTTNELMGDLVRKIEEKKISLNEEIEKRLKVAKNKRMDRIKELDENSVIARKLSIKRIENMNASSTSQFLNSSGQIALPLYYLGYEVLETEKENLTQRSDDSVFAGIRDLQEDVAYLGNLKINPETLDVVRISQIPLIEDSFTKPKKTLVLSLGLISGVMLGIFIAFILNWWKTSKKQFDLQVVK